MALTRVEMENFTAFSRLKLDLSPGVNVLVGANGTGKTHLMKVCYAACDVSRGTVGFAEKLVSVFLPSGRALGRLVRRQQESSRGSVKLYRGSMTLRSSFSNHALSASSAHTRGGRAWLEERVESVYIPVKEMLSNAPGFPSLYSKREVHFEEVYRDILERAYLPLLRGPIDRQRKRLLSGLQAIIDGKVAVRGEEFFLRNRQGNLEFSLLAEGMRKLGLLWLLIQNGALQNGSVLFWDEPETNLNPRLFGELVEVLLELQRAGVQVFLATHDYVILKELDLRTTAADRVSFHSLYRKEGADDVHCDTTCNYRDIHPNAIAETFTDLYDREVSRSLNGAEP